MQLFGKLNYLGSSLLTPRPKPWALYHTSLGILYQELSLRDCVVHVNSLEWKGQDRMERHFFPNLKQLHTILNIHILSSRKFSFQCLLLFFDSLYFSLSFSPPYLFIFLSLTKTYSHRPLPNPKDIETEHTGTHLIIFISSSYFQHYLHKKLNTSITITGEYSCILPLPIKSLLTMK